jgi:hypothetical protein
MGRALAHHRAMKKVVRILLVLVIVLIVAVIAFTFFLGSIVKKSIETVGPQVAKVEVKLDSAKLSLLSGSGTLNGFFVGNPQGFNSPSAIKAGEITVEVQPGSVFSDKVVVRSVRVLAPEITLHGLKGDNLMKILDNLKASTGGGTADKNSEKPAGQGKKIEVDDFLIKDGKVNLILPMVGAASVALPEIHLTGLGTGSSGLTGPELSAKVINAVLEAAVSAAARSGASAKLMEGSTKEAGKQVDKVLKGVGNLLK